MQEKQNCQLAQVGPFGNARAVFSQQGDDLVLLGGCAGGAAGARGVHRHLQRCGASGTPDVHTCAMVQEVAYGARAASAHRAMEWRDAAAVDCIDVCARRN